MERHRRAHNPNQDSKVRAPWFTAECREAQRHMWATQRCHGRHSAAALAAQAAYRRTCRAASRKLQASYPELLKKRPKEFWALVSPPRHAVTAPVPALATVFQQVFFDPAAPHPGPVPPALPLSPPITAEELAEVLRLSYRGSASAGLSPLPS